MIFVYYLFCGLSIFMAFLAQKRNSKILFVFSLVFVCLISGLRAESVGIDTKTYYDFIEWAGKGKLKNIEIGFIHFTRFLLRINNSTEFVIFVYSVLTIVFMFLRFWTLRDKASYSLMVFIYLALYFQLSMNIMRQFFAISIVFFATYFLQKRKRIPYIIFTILGTTFHISAILGVIIFIIDFLYSKEKLIKKVIFSVFVLIGISLIIHYGHELVGRYESYFENANVDIGLMVFAKLVLLLAFMFFNHDIFLSKNNNEITVKVFIFAYVLGLLLTCTGYVFSYMERLGLCFMMFEPVCMAMMCKRNNSGLFKIAILAITCFIIFMSYKSNANGIFPYNWIL